MNRTEHLRKWRTIKRTSWYEFATILSDVLPREQEAPSNKESETLSQEQASQVEVPTGILQKKSQDP
jgi:hypothetical protein